MMDEKLREILPIPKQGAWVQIKDADKLIAAIKQAFAENFPHGIYNVNKSGFMRLSVDEAMTGTEWYERFEKELENDGIERPTWTRVMVVARRASGLDGDNDPT